MKTKVTIEEVSMAIITGLLVLAAVCLFTGCAVVNTAPIKQEIVK